MSNIFKTTVLGVGPWCVEFSDGEIVHCRTEARAKLIAAAPELFASCKALLERYRIMVAADGPEALEAARVISKVESI